MNATLDIKERIKRNIPSFTVSKHPKVDVSPFRSTIESNNKLLKDNIKIVIKDNESKIVKVLDGGMINLNKVDVVSSNYKIEPNKRLRQNLKYNVKKVGMIAHAIKRNSTKNSQTDKEEKINRSISPFKNSNNPFHSSASERDAFSNSPVKILYNSYNKNQNVINETESDKRNFLLTRSNSSKKVQFQNNLFNILNNNTNDNVSNLNVLPEIHNRNIDVPKRMIITNMETTMNKTQDKEKDYREVSPFQSTNAKKITNNIYNVNVNLNVMSNDHRKSMSEKRNKKLKKINQSVFSIDSHNTMNANLNKSHEQNNLNKTKFLFDNNKRSNFIQKYACKSKAGMTYDGSTKINQDSYLIKTKIFELENFHVFGVFDGHGVHGHFASNAIKLFMSDYFSKIELYIPREKLRMAMSMSEKNINIHQNIINLFPEYMREESIYEKLKENDYALIKSAFKDAEIVLSQTKYEINFSGSTCVLMIQIDDKIIFANAGDSRAILVQEDDEKINRKIIETRDHKPELKDEKERILKSGGRVDKYTDKGGKSGPYRVWVRNENFPGLAMSRSIGDFVAGSVGVISEPGKIN